MSTISSVEVADNASLTVLKIHAASSAVQPLSFRIQWSDDHELVEVDSTSASPIPSSKYELGNSIRRILSLR